MCCSFGVGVAILSGRVRQGAAGRVRARQGAAGRGRARQGAAGRGRARQGAAGRGRARQGAARCGSALHGARLRGMARHEAAVRCTALTLHGAVQRDIALHGAARCGSALHGAKRLDNGRQGDRSGTRQAMRGKGTKASNVSARSTRCCLVTAATSLTRFVFYRLDLLPRAAVITRCYTPCNSQ